MSIFVKMHGYQFNSAFPFCYYLCMVLLICMEMVKSNLTTSVALTSVKIYSKSMVVGVSAMKTRERVLKISSPSDYCDGTINC